MFDLIDFIRTIIRTNLPDVQFIHGEEEDANINATSVTDEIIYLQRPYTAKGSVTSTTILPTVFKIDMFFLKQNTYQSEGNATINNYQDTIDSNQLTDTGNSMHTFLKKVYNHDNVDPDVFNFNYLDITDFSYFDNNVSGWWLQFEFKIRNAGNLCE